MVRKVSAANQAFLESLAHLVSVVTRELQVLEVKWGPPRGGPQAFLAYLDHLVRKESRETLRVAPQAPQGREAFQERPAPKD